MKRLRFSTPQRRALLAAVATLALLLTAWWLLGQSYREQLLREEQGRVAAQLYPYGNALTTAVNRRLALLEGLAAFVKTHPTEAELLTDFDAFASGLYASSTAIRALQVFGPEGSVHVYPRAGNEATVSRDLDDLLNDERPDVRADVQRTVQTRRIALSQPYELRQGGLGLVGRLAIYEGDVFWGLLVVVLDMPPILTEVGLNAGVGGLDLTVRDAAGRVFSGEPRVFQAQPIIYQVALPEGVWELAAVPTQGWDAAISGPLRLFQGGALTIALLCAALVYHIVNRQGHLTQAVAERTRELAAVNADLLRSMAAREQAIVHEQISAEKYKVLFDAFPLGITVTDPAGNILEANAASERLLGISADEHTRRAITGAEWRIIRPDGTPMPGEEFASYRALHESRLVSDVEMGIVKDDGATTWLSVTAAPLPLAGYGVVITYNDITDRKQAEEALRASEERFRRAVADAPFPMLIHAEDGEIVLAN
jgi:PAS domain S-box-containing protein